MLDVHCSGNPYEIGQQHGSAAKDAIGRCIDFYASLFQQYAKQSWPQVLETAARFESSIKAKWPRFYEEMQGVANGSERTLLDIIALNVRTEIAFGLFSDGCTSAYSRNSNSVLQGQNWDWNPAQKPQLIRLRITQHRPLPDIDMITEAGLIGKIGLNSHGVGVCFNALNSPGIAYKNIPAHLASRSALEARSVAEAASAIETAGAASSFYVLVGDPDEAFGLECTVHGVRRQRLDRAGRLWHANHMLLDHGSEVQDKTLWPDSPDRVSRIGRLLGRESTEDITFERFSSMFENEQDYPVSICRKAVEGKSSAETLFNIVMNLRERRAVVRLGRPTNVEERVMLGFEGNGHVGEAAQNGIDGKV
ncbi:MAG: hypothetical protein M1828_000640 [Chrysothrix sp. TS-e1954]|nr:MAG: hypothetical protein M1828_000640 [Chrysothrix sp. TS-e1954]